MIRSERLLQAFFKLVAALFLFATAFAAAPAPKGLGDPGQLNALRIESADKPGSIVLKGADARRQLFVSGVYSSGQLRDVTRNVTLQVDPAGIVNIDPTGLLKPLADGAGKLLVTHSTGIKAEIPLRVEGMTAEQPSVSFKNQIVPIFTKLACNSGGCHGKASGQNGFKLSLLGFFPEDDYEYLVKEDRGRRLFPLAPEESLLLQKPTGQLPHGGGKRLEADSDEYRMLHRWIDQGMPYGKADDPVVAGIQCVPAGRVMDRNTEQQIAVVATYSNGITEDVTRSALYEANVTDMADVDKAGLVRTHDLAGEVAIMARYQGQVATFRATIPLGAPVDAVPKSHNFIDDAVFGKLKVLGIPPSPVCDDGTYLRRVYLDVTGNLPTDAVVRQFLADNDPAKRNKLLDRLLDSNEYADFFANKWNFVLRNKKRAAEDLPGTYAFYRWIWTSLYENKPYNQFVTEILTASGERNLDPPVVWYREVDQLNKQVEDTAQLFLGLRIQCARCHHHPFEKWSQNDYYGLAAFFSRLGKKNPPSGMLQNNAREMRVVHEEGVAMARNIRTGQELKPTPLGGTQFSVPADRDPRVYLAGWLSDPKNPFFAKALVNRYWKHFFSRGIVEPEDDIRETNPPANPELLDKLSASFVESGFDLKQLVRTICRSQVYQLSALPNDYNLNDRQNFSRYYPKRLSAEVLYDGFHQVTGSSQDYTGIPSGMHAVQLPDPTVGTYFLQVFGQPQGETACECERSQEANLAQSLHLLNSGEVQSKISSGTGRAAKLAAETTRSHEDRIRELYHWTYARDPQADELKSALAHIQKHSKNPKAAYEDLVWALVNTKEFLFNH